MADSEERFASTIRVKRSAEEYIPASTERAVRFVIWLFGGIILLTATATTAWLLHGSRLSDLERRVDAYDKLKLARDTQVAELQIYNQGQTRWNDAVLKDVNRNSKWIDDFSKPIMEMIFMKEHGISNKEDFIMRHGYPAPSNPTADPEKR